MKTKNLFTASIFIVVTFISIISSGAPESSISKSILGLWIGTYLYDQRPQNLPQYFCFFIKPDDTILVESEGAGEKYYAMGTWTLQRNQFIATYTTFSFPLGEEHRTQTSRAIFKDNSILTGKWETAISILATGTFSLKKIN